MADQYGEWQRRWRRLNRSQFLGGLIDQVSMADFDVNVRRVTRSLDGTETHMVSVRLRRMPNRSMADIQEYISLALRMAVVDTLPGRRILPNAFFGAQNVNTGNYITNPTNPQGKKYFQWSQFTANSIQRTMSTLTSQESQDLDITDITWECTVRDEEDFDFELPEGALDQWPGFGKRKRDVLEVGDSYCGTQSLIVGMDWLKGGRDMARPTGTYARTRLRKARELQAELGLDTDGGMVIADFKKFVEVYPTYRVKIFLVRGDVFLSNKVVTYTGSDFQQPQGEGVSALGKTIHILYNLDKEHFTPISKNNVKSLYTEAKPGDKDPSKVRICPHCDAVFRFHTPKQQRAYLLEHNCRERSACGACGDYYENVHKHLAQGSLCPNRCGLTVGGAGCLKKHIQLCPSRTVCPECGGSHTGANCGKRLCVGCMKRIPMGDLVSTHRCCWTVKKPKKENDAESVCTDISDLSEVEVKDGLNNIWAYDIEALQEEVLKPSASMTWPRSYFYDREVNFEQDGVPLFPRGKVYQHVPALIQARNLGTGELITWDCKQHEDPLLEFIIYFLKFKERQYLYAHNGSGYDAPHIYNCIVDNIGEICIKDIKSGGLIMESCKIKRMQFGECVLLDSLLHLKSKLDDLPKMLEFDLEEFEEKYGFRPKKTHFPYTFATRATVNYVGSLPPLEEYGIERFAPKDQDELRKWHAEESERVGDKWNMWETYKAYLNIDTAILAEAIISYRRLCLEAGFLDPVGRLTLPSLCLHSFKELYMPEDTIPILRCYPEIRQRELYGGHNEFAFCKEAYRGGNTTNWYLAFVLDEQMLQAGWAMLNMDYVSMYPSVMVNRPYPTGDYEWMEFRDAQPRLEDILHKEGILCCEIGPTRAIAHPILHRVINGKLCFPLIKAYPAERAEHFHKFAWNRADLNPGQICSVGCTLCIPNYQPQPYTMPEIREAIAQGYEITWFYGALFSTETRSDIYNDYYGKAYGNKVQHSKPPKFNWSDPEVCKEYVRQLWEKSCIRVPQEFHSHPQDWHQPNAALKQMGKLQANSFYGKLGADVFKETVSLASGVDEEQELLNGKKGELAGQPIYHGNAVLVRHKTRAAQRNIKETNMMHAAYVTAYARIKLTREMNSITSNGGKVLYCDTDSILAAFPPGCPLPATGPYLGELEDETVGKGTLCEYVGLLPKSYAIRNTDEKVVKMRFKGVSGVTEGAGGDKRNASLLTWYEMVAMADAVLEGKGMGYPVHHRIARWNRNSFHPSITWQESWKLARADFKMLKGKLATSARIYPLGAENFDWGEEIEWVDGN